jgi:L-aminopeptidase/D-esterase-like protein
LLHQHSTSLVESAVSGKRDSILDVPGISVGHAHDFHAMTGCTVLLCPDGAVGGLDIRGSAAGTRQIDALYPEHSVPLVHAIMVAGGSAFGLESAGGVMRFLEELGVGYEVPVGRVPIVPTAVIFDLGFGRSDARPDSRMGYEACLNASSSDLAEGSVGAGTGATIGKFYGTLQATKGGVGSCSERLLEGAGVIIGAIAIVNAFGDVLDINDSKTIIAGARTTPESHSFADTALLFRSGFKRQSFSISNTTIGIIATNARLTKQTAAKVARIAQNGLAKSILPAHTTFDGDIVFVLSTGQEEVDLNGLCLAAETTLRKAIQRAVVEAHGFGLIPAYRDLASQNLW